ncbi:MAG: DUF1349 domain-containing protein [Akkermansiaceae bacterium]|nr:DUF1349 domain-containing protein [Akkermansiaceae bacterium]
MFAARDARRAGGAWRLAGRAAWAALLWPALAPLAGPAVAGGEPAVIARPVEVFWGGYRRNEQLVDEGAAGWEQVRQHLDGVILHGAYWNQASNSIGSPSPDIVGPKLAALLAGAGGRKVLLEHLLGGVYPDVEAAFGAAAAGDPAAPAGFSSGVPNIRRLMSYGFPLPEVSTDFIMDAWRQSVRMHPHWTSREFFTALAGSWETYHGAEFDPAPGSADRAKFGWFRQWVEGLAAAFPHIRVSCTNSPVYFNWDEGGTNRRELGGNYNNFFTWLKLERRGDHITALYSGDGAGWRALGGATVPLGGAPVAGLFAASLDAGRLAQARFDNLRVLPCYFADIGKTGLGGSLATDGASYTLKGRGNEALHPGNNTSDALFLAWREWTGDGVFTARLDSLTNSNPGRTNPAGEIASAGITLRESSARDARQVSLLANFANQLEFLARGTTGGGLAPRRRHHHRQSLGRRQRLDGAGHRRAAPAGDGAGGHERGQPGALRGGDRGLLAGGFPHAACRFVQRHKCGRGRQRRDFFAGGFHRDAQGAGRGAGGHGGCGPAVCHSIGGRRHAGGAAGVVCG